MTSVTLSMRNAGRLSSCKTILLGYYLSTPGVPKSILWISLESLHKYLHGRAYRQMQQTNVTNYALDCLIGWLIKCKLTAVRGWQQTDYGQMHQDFEQTLPNTLSCCYVFNKKLHNPNLIPCNMIVQRLWIINEIENASKWDKTATFYHLIWAVPM